MIVMDPVAKNSLLLLLGLGLEEGGLGLALDFQDDDDTLTNLMAICALTKIINNHSEKEERERIARHEQYAQLLGQMEVVNMACLHVIAKDRRARPKRLWALPSSRSFWETMVLPNYNDEFWIKNFRMTRSTFSDIAEQLSPHIAKKTTNMREAIAVEHRLAITLWKLATNMEYRSVGHLFGVGRSTVCAIVHETCEAIERFLMPKYIRFPQGQELLDTVQRFDTKFGFPQVAGAIDGTHIKIRAPEESPEDYFNRKSDYSIVLQAVVDADGRFTDTNVGRPGSVHDARVFALSSLSRKMNQGTLFNPNPTKVIKGQDVPLLIIGDPAYPLLPNLIKGYTARRRLTREQTHFNYRLSKARFVVEHAFGRLKGRWRILNKQNDHCLAFNRPLVQSCCTLHNICEKNGDPFQLAWLADVNINDNRQVNRQRPMAEATRIREALKEHLKTH